MDQFLRDTNRDTILFVNELNPRSIGVFDKAVAKLEEMLKRELKVLMVTEKRDRKAARKRYPDYEQIFVNTEDVFQLEKALMPYLDNLLLIVCRSEKDIPYFKNIIPHVPYLATPTMESLDWANDKINLRRRLRAYDKTISPAYTIVEDAGEGSIEKIEAKIGYPAIVKPAGLAASVLVSLVYHRDELEEVLKSTLKKVKKVYKQRGRLTQPKLLVEQYMEGEMYSTDIYVNSRGTMYTTPLIYVQTAQAIGRDDFYGYRQMTPVGLKVHKHYKAFDVAKAAVEALGLRSITAHVELMRTFDGWKVIEVGPRTGGFRDFLYMQSYGFDHALNDLLIRLPMRPKIKRKPLGYSTVMKIYTEKEGTLKSFIGIKRIKELASFKSIDVNKKKGDVVRFSRNGGVSIADIYLFNETRSSMLADVRRIEKMLDIKVGPLTAKKTSIAPAK